METLIKKTKANNTVNLLNLYRTSSSIWCFDDKDLDIVAEPFVGEINTMIDMYTNGKKNCLVYISASPIPNSTLSLTKAQRTNFLEVTKMVEREEDLKNIEKDDIKTLVKSL